MPNISCKAFEKSLYREGAVEKVLTKLEADGNTYVHEGATWLKTSTYNDEKDRVIVKGDGSYTYLLPDIAYHANKLSRGYTHLIDVLGADHHGYIERLKVKVIKILKEICNEDIDLVYNCGFEPEDFKDKEKIKILRR